MKVVYIVEQDSGSYGRYVAAVFSEEAKAVEYCKKKNGGYASYSYDAMVVDQEG